jgi:hypothetical protein
MTKKKSRGKYYGEPAEKIKADHLGPLHLLAFTDGHVMCRRPGGTPFVLSVREWDAIGKCGLRHFQIVNFCAE